LSSDPTAADAELTLAYSVLGSTLRPLAQHLKALPAGGVLALTTDDP